MLLVIAQHSDPDKISTGYYWEKIIIELSRNHEILLLTEDRPSSLEKNDKVKIIQIGAPSYLKNYLNFGVGAFLKVYMSLKMLIEAIKSSRNKESILIGTNPFLIVLLPLILKIFFIKAKVNILLFDLFPENLIATSNNSFLKIILRALKNLFNFSYRRAFKIFSIGRDMSKILENKKIEKNKIIYSPNWCDDEFEEDEKKKKKNLASLGINYDSDKNTIILYFGNLGHFQNIEFFLKIIAKTKNENLIFLFVGNGKKRNLVKKAAKHDKRIFLRDGIPISQRSRILVCGDISLVTLSEKMYGLAVPSKSYFSLAYRMPVLSLMSKESEVSCLLQENNFGWTFSLEEKNELVNFLENLSKVEIEIKKNNIILKEDSYRSSYSINKITDTILKSTQ